MHIASIFLCLVLLVVSIFSSFIQYNEELPLYLTDDFVLSKSAISKRSATENINVQSSSTESNNKDVTSEKETSSTSTTPKVPNNHPEVEKEEESGLVFLPSFGRRTRRAVTEKKKEDLLNLESSLVFLPSFRRNGFRRSRRDIHVSKRSADASIESNANRNPVPSNSKNKNTNQYESSDLNNGESGLVFLPSFGRRTRSIAKRDTSNIDNIKTKFNTSPLETTEQNEELINSETEEEQESGLVFLPSIERRTRRDLTKVSSSSENNESTTNEPLNSSTTDKTSSTTGKDDEIHRSNFKEEESGLVFLPSFGRRTRRDVSKVSLSEKNKKGDSGVSDPEKSSNNESEEEEESGLVFLPSFGRRTRRDVSKGSLSEKNKKGDSGVSDPEKSSKNESEEEEESGLVFLPSFSRRSRRDVQTKVVIKRDLDKSPLVLNNVDEEEKKGNDKQINDDMDLSENGMVFLTSFGKKH